MSWEKKTRKSPSTHTVDGGGSLNAERKRGQSQISAEGKGFYGLAALGRDYMQK